MLGIVRSSGSDVMFRWVLPFNPPFLPFAHLPLPATPPPAPSVSCIEGVLPWTLGVSPLAACSSPLLLVPPLFVGRLRFGGEEAASPRCLVYWLLPSLLIFLPGPFLCVGLSAAPVKGGGLFGWEEGNGDSCPLPLGLGVSSLLSGSEVQRQRCESTKGD